MGNKADPSDQVPDLIVDLPATRGQWAIELIVDRLFRPAIQLGLIYCQV
jgi:hypothetical protein